MQRKDLREEGSNNQEARSVAAACQQELARTRETEVSTEIFFLLPQLVASVEVLVNMSKSVSKKRATVIKRPEKVETESKIQQYLNSSPTASGYLKKLSSKEKWQKRFFQIRGPYLM